VGLWQKPTRQSNRGPHVDPVKTRFHGIVPGVVSSTNAFISNRTWRAHYSGIGGPWGSPSKELKLTIGETGNNRCRLKGASVKKKLKSKGFARQPHSKISPRESRSTCPGFREQGGLAPTWTRVGKVKEVASSQREGDDDETRR